jgi:hypothetical protein
MRRILRKVLSRIEASIADETSRLLTSVTPKGTVAVLSLTESRLPGPE